MKPPYTERYVRWCERTADEVIIRLLLDSEIAVSYPTLKLLGFLFHSQTLNTNITYSDIEVPFTECIPSDYDGVMGVPISFLNKYNPEQFEILGVTQRNDDPYKTKKYTKNEYTNANDLNARGTIIVNGVPKSMYARILIRAK